jgi:M6 family metalloprotease-like protein
MTPNLLRYARKSHLLANANTLHLSILLVLLLLSRVTEGIKPKQNVRASSSAHGNNVETIDQYRRRMEIKFDYKMRVLNPELCRDSTEQECQDTEDDFLEQAQRLRNLQNNQHQHNSTHHDARNLQNTDSTGTINVVVLLIRFTNHASRVLPDPADIDTLFNDPGKDEDITPTGSVSTYLETNSYGDLKINAFVAPNWVESAGDEQFCAQTTKGANADFINCFAPALDALEASGISWSDYDLDGDGRLDAVIVLHSGYASNQGDVDEDDVDSSVRIKAHANVNNQQLWTSQRTGISLGNFVVTSTYRGSADQNICRINVICHEFLHILGVIDIYDFSFNGNGAGGFAIMAYPYGHTGSRAGSKTPGNVSPWIKIQLGWLTPIAIETDGTYPITPSLTTRQVYIISDPYPEGEYLLIENRQKLQWDSELKGSGGVVIWSIDDSIEGNTASGQEVVVVQADGLFDLENKRNFGDEGDFFLEGRELGPTGDLSTKSRRTGATTGFTISGFSESSSAMSFTVSGLAAPQATTPAPTPPPTPVPTLASPTQAPTPAPTPLPTKAPFTYAPITKIADLSCNVTLDTCSTKFNDICDNDQPECAGQDCADCDECKQFHYDCTGCIANGCYFCPGDATCYNSDTYVFNIFSQCTKPEDYLQDSCQPPDSSNFWRYGQATLSMERCTSFSCLHVILHNLVPFCCY